MNKNVIIGIIVVIVVIIIAAFMIMQQPSETGEEPQGQVDPTAQEATVSVSTDTISYHLILQGLAPEAGEAGTYGYGVITEAGTDAIAAITTHGGWRDSILQQDAQDPHWHVHFVRLGEVELCGENPGVIDLSWESAGEVTLSGNEIIAEGIPSEFEGTHSVTGESVFFAPGVSVQNVVQFSLDPVYVGEGVAAVCVTDITEVPFTVASVE